MKNKMTLLFAVAAIGVLAVTTAFTSNARIARTEVAHSVAKKVSYPADLIEMRAEFESQCAVYEELIKPYHQRLEDLSEEKLTKAEADELLAEVDEVVGEQEKLVKTLRNKLRARFQQLG